MPARLRARLHLPGAVANHVKAFRRAQFGIAKR